MRKYSLHTVPALAAAVLLAAGIVVGRQIPFPVSYGIAFTLVLILVSAMVVRRRQSNPSAVDILSPLLILLLLVVGATKYRFDSTLTPPLPESLLKRQVVVVGRIHESPTTRENRTRFLFQLEEIRDSARIHSTSLPQVLVTVVRQRKDSVVLPLEYGSRIHLAGQLYRPSAERNPGEFNSRAYYEAQGIPLLMRVKGFRNVSFVEAAASGGVFDWPMRNVVIPVRSHILALIDSTIGGEEGELLKGIFMGERGGIPYSTRLAFVNSGTAHILAVSGSNVAVVFAFFTGVFALLRVPRTANIILTALCLLLYMLLTGSQPPIVRATIMALVMMCGTLVGERANALNALGVAALLIFLYDARQLFDVGFQLSFLAVFSLAYFFPIARGWLPSIKRRNMWRRVLVGALELVVLTFVVTLGTLPLIALYFGRVSVVGLLSNVVVVPLVGISVALGFVSAICGWFSFFIAETFASLNWGLLKVCLWIAKFTGNLSWAYVDTLQFRPMHAIPFYLALLTVFHLHVKTFARKLLIAFIASLNLVLLPSSSVLDQSRDGTLRVSFIDVGQGDGALIEFPNGQTMLIDAGATSEEYDTGERIVTPFLKRRGVSTINYLVASHPHNDHIGGFLHVFKTFDVKRVMESGQPARDSIYVEYVKAIRNEQCAVDTVRSNQFMVEIGSAKLYVLSPPGNRIDPDTTHPHENLNNTSVVFKLCYGATSFLFTGDVEWEAEAEMAKLYGEFLHSTVLKVGHHGGSTSSTQEFLNYVKPRYAVISCGLNNKFNHPSEEVLEKFRSVNCETMRTDEEGAVMFETDGKRLERIDWR